MIDWLVANPKVSLGTSGHQQLQNQMLQANLKQKKALARMKAE